MTDILEILEDQIFLLNNIRVLKPTEESVYNFLVKHKNSLSDIFLSFNEILNCKKLIKYQLIKLFRTKDIDNEWNIQVNIYMRGLCHCLILIKEVHMNSLGLFKDTYLSIPDIDRYLTDLSMNWTTNSNIDILNDIKILLNYLYTFGSLHCLPIGIGIENMKCFICRKNGSIPTGKKENMIETCTHILVEIPTKFELNELSSHEDIIFEVEKGDMSSLGHKLKSFQMRKEMNTVKDVMRNISEKYKKLELEKHHLLSLKCISPFLYQLLGFYIKMLSNRFNFLSMFLGNEFCGKRKNSNVEISSRCLKNILMDIKYSKSNMMAIREEFSNIYICPYSFYDEKCSIFRKSIIMKKCYIASGMSEEQVDKISKNMLQISFEKALENEAKENDIYFVLFTFITYNTWLSMNKIPACFHIKWARSDLHNHVAPTVLFLYEKNQVGFMFDNENILFNCDQVFEICLNHLYHIYNKGICKHSTQIQKVLDLFINHHL